MLLEVQNLKTYFPIHRGLLQSVVGYVQAVDGVSFKLQKGELGVFIILILSQLI